MDALIFRSDIGAINNVESKKRTDKGGSTMRFFKTISSMLGPNPNGLPEPPRTARQHVACSRASPPAGVDPNATLVLANGEWGAISDGREKPEAPCNGHDDGSEEVELRAEG